MALPFFSACRFSAKDFSAMLAVKSPRHASSTLQAMWSIEIPTRVFLGETEKDWHHLVVPSYFYIDLKPSKTNETVRYLFTQNIPALLNHLVFWRAAHFVQVSSSRWPPSASHKPYRRPSKSLGVARTIGQSKALNSRPPHQSIEPGRRWPTCTQRRSSAPDTWKLGLIILCHKK